MAEKITRNLYNGEVAIDFYPKSHRYKLQGEKTYLVSVTSATGIIDKSRFLIPWAVNITVDYLKQNLSLKDIKPEELGPMLELAGKQHRIKKEEAGDIGSQVHDWVEKFTFAKSCGEEMPALDGNWDERIVNGVTAFIEWYTNNEVEFRAAEQMVYSRKHDYVGLFDCFAIVNGVPTIIDYKTSKGVYNEMRYQLCAYWAAYQEQYPDLKIGQAIILHFNKENGEFNELVITPEEFKKDLDTFLSCLSIKKRERELNSGYS